MDLTEMFGLGEAEAAFILAIGSAATFALRNFDQYCSEIEEVNNMTLTDEERGMYRFQMAALAESTKPVAEEVVVRVQTADLMSELEGKHEKDTEIG